MNSVVCAPVESKQPNILSMFAAAATKSTAVGVPAKKTLPAKSAVVVVATSDAEKPTDLISEDPLVAAFYKSLTPAEMTAHRIATVKLGTSYDVTRTRGFLAWSKTRGASAT